MFWEKQKLSTEQLTMTFLKYRKLGAWGGRRKKRVNVRAGKGRKVGERKRRPEELQLFVWSPG